MICITSMFKKGSYPKDILMMLYYYKLKTTPITFSTTLLNNIEAHKSKYLYENNIELFTILPKSILPMDRKIFVKIENLTYFSKIKKYGKI